MSEVWSNESVAKDHCAVAQVAIYIFAVLQVVVALMTESGAVPLGIAPQASTMQQISTTTYAVVNVLCFVVGYVLLARCMNCCTRLVWRIALTIFLINTGIAALAFAAQPGPHPVLTCSLSIAGVISVWNGRGVARRHSSAFSGN